MLPTTENPTPAEQPSGLSAIAGYAPSHPRRPLASGNIYRFKGYARNGIRINAVAFRGHPEDDGALEGVSVTWLNATQQRFWYPCKSETEFWSDIRFANACDPESA
jgi:hypothetical protein